MNSKDKEMFEYMTMKMFEASRFEEIVKAVEDGATIEDIKQIISSKGADEDE